jgi:hypothetical protein
MDRGDGKYLFDGTMMVTMDKHSKYAVNSNRVLLVLGRLLTHSLLTCAGFFLCCFSLEQIVFRDGENLPKSIAEFFSFRPAGDIRRW